MSFGVDHPAARIEHAITTATALTEQVGKLVDIETGILKDVRELAGDALARLYRDRPFAYLQRIVRGARTMTGDELFAFLSAAVERGQISPEEEDEIMLADAVVRGQRRADGAEVCLVVEVSWGVGVDDVRRATERSAALAKTGVTAVPVVAGELVITEARLMAEDEKVWQVTDGHAVAPNG